jgi:hypothetical protein
MDRLRSLAASWELRSMRTLRVAFVLLLLLGLTPVATTYVDAKLTDNGGRTPVPESVPPADGITVMTVDGLGPGLITAYAPNGSRIYYDDEYRFYHDVDPSIEGGNATVTYVASYETQVGNCGDADVCSVSAVERVNLTTGEKEVLYERLVPDNGTDNVHDVDVINDTHLVVADIAYPDRIYMANYRTGETVWEWRAEEYYDTSKGGKYPWDWTHLNDVEYLDNGLVMASIRNFDEVVFLRPGEGVVENMTLGENNRRSILYEQHNPDYIPPSMGGPAVLVADSENNRIVEYQRQNGNWELSWRWRTHKVQWPRDADRLPNDHTLVTDTHADRVVEVNEQGEVVWSASIPGPYEAERLNTPAESGGGRSAEAADLQNRGIGSGLVNQVVWRVNSVVPPLVLHATLFVLPNWVRPTDAVGLLFVALVVVGWVLTETGWFVYRRRFA